MTDDTYIAGANLPDLAIQCSDDGGPVDLSSGYTFELRIGSRSHGLIAKTTGITGTATGVIVVWATTGELLDLPAGGYTLDLIARTGGKQRVFRASMKVGAGIPAPV